MCAMLFILCVLDGHNKRISDVLDWLEFPLKNIFINTLFLDSA